MLKDDHIEVRCLVDELLFVGYGEEERAYKQPVEIDVRVFIPIAHYEEAQRKLKGTLDYRILKDVIQGVVTEKKEHVLLEQLADEIARRSLTIDGVQAVRAELHKPQLKATGINAYVTVERRRPD